MNRVSEALCLMAAGSILAAGAAGTAGQSDRGKAVDSLVEAERSFSRTAEERGIRAAFLAWLAPDAVVFRPGPVEGRPVYEKMDPADPARLTWEPEVAEIAASGEMGYTSGPYQLRPGRGAEPTAFGHYISVWKKQPDGSWKVLLDIGVRHGRPEPAASPGTFAAPSGAAVPPLSMEKLRSEEHAFGVRAGSFENEVAKKGLRKALASFATEDIRVLRPGQFPAIGMRAAAALIPAEAGRVSRAELEKGQWKTTYHVGMAWSGDLTYSYGTTELVKAGVRRETTVYLRIWRRQPSGTWNISLDIELPVNPS